MDIYAIWGQDVIYGGLHGMKNTSVILAEDDAEATEAARELAEETIMDYDCIYEALEEDVRTACEESDIAYGYGSEAEEEIRSEIYNDDLDYGAAVLDKLRLSTSDLNKLDQMFYDDEEGFLEEYAKAYL
jgi:hypothetical protein